MATGEIEVWSGLCSWLYALFRSNPPSNQALVEYSGVGPGSRVLDIGSGPGASLEHALRAGAQVSGVDPSPSMVKRASRRVEDARVVQGSAEHLDFADGSFTHVWAISSFHHWTYPDAALDEIKRVLDIGGRVYLMERRLDEGKTGHGLTMAEATELASSLSGMGLAETRVDPLRAGRHDYLVVTGTVTV
jgi:ubiquinone/menaquinone biosynthesis C-methylase UbiE